MYSPRMSKSPWPVRSDGRLHEWPQAPPGEAELFDRLRDVCEEGLDRSARFAASRPEGWHSFVPADYDQILEALLSIGSSSWARP